MKYIVLFACILFTGCATDHSKFTTSVFTGEKFPDRPPLVAHPKLKTYYVYSGDTLLTTFSSISTDTPQFNISTQLFSGNVDEETKGNLTEYILRGGAIRWMRLDKKLNKSIEVGRITSDYIIWFEPKK